MSQIFTPNYTQIPNVIFDYWMEKLTPAEFKVLLCICRKTFGWHKSRDKISLKQIMDMTGLSSRSSLVKTLTNLEGYGLINKIKSKTKDGDPAPNRYEVNVLSEDGGSTLSAPGVVLSEHQGSTLSAPTKERPTKENLKKEEREGSASPPRAPVTPKKIKRRENVETSVNEHTDLCNKYGEEKVELLYDRLQEWKEDTPKSKWKKNDARSINRWVADAVNEEKVKEKKRNGIAEAEDNVTFAKRVADNFNLQRAPSMSIALEAQREGLLIYSTHPTCSKQDFISYKEKGFKDQVDNALRKWRLK